MHGGNSTDFGVTATANMRGLGDGSADFDNKRFLAKANFFHLRVDASHTLTFAGGYQFYAHFLSQFATEPLISNEQFSIGGLDTVRGYQESTALGDFGGAGQLELRSRDIGGWFGVDNARLHMFFDEGYARIHDPLPEQRPSETLASTGIGATLKAFTHFNSSFDLTVPLSDPDNAKMQKRLDFLFRTWGEF